MVCKDMEGSLVNEMARSPSVERSGSERCSPDDPGAFRVNDLIVELELDPILRTPTEYDEEEVMRAWIRFTGCIQEHLARSTSVVVRGWTPSFPLRFSKLSLAHQLGNLGQRCQWIDGIRYAESQEAPGITYHEVTTLERFIDLADDPKVCGNFLDAKDGNPTPPPWMQPLLDSTMAWNQTMHLHFMKERSRSKKKNTEVDIDISGPTVIRSSTWTSQGWRLLTHAGFVTFAHNDCCGFCTYVLGEDGAKGWMSIRPKEGICAKSLSGLPKMIELALEQSPDGRFPNADVAMVWLESGDTM